MLDALLFYSKNTVSLIFIKIFKLSSNFEHICIINDTDLKMFTDYGTFIDVHVWLVS